MSDLRRRIIRLAAESEPALKKDLLTILKDQADPASHDQNLPATYYGLPPKGKVASDGMYTLSTGGGSDLEEVERRIDREADGLSRKASSFDWIQPGDEYWFTIVFENRSKINVNGSAVDVIRAIEKKGLPAERLDWEIVATDSMGREIRPKMQMFLNWNGLTPDLGSPKELDKEIYDLTIMELKDRLFGHHYASTNPSGEKMATIHPAPFKVGDTYRERLHRSYPDKYLTGKVIAVKPGLLGNKNQYLVQFKVPSGPAYDNIRESYEKGVWKQDDDMEKQASTNPSGVPAMSDAALRSGLIRLAHAKPELRKHLLPLLTKEAAGPTYKEYVEKKRKKGEKPLDEAAWETRVNGKDEADSGAKDAPKSPIPVKMYEYIGADAVKIGEAIKAGKPVPREEAEKVVKTLESAIESGKSGKAAIDPTVLKHYKNFHKFLKGELSQGGKTAALTIPGVHLVEDLSAIENGLKIVFRERGGDLLGNEENPGYYLSVGGILKRLVAAEKMSPAGELKAKKALSKLLMKL